MNRRNYTVHVALAAALVLLAAAAGRIERWQRGRAWEPRMVKQTAPPRRVSPEDERARRERENTGEPEVLVRFRAGVSEERIQAIAAGLHDRVEDEIESVEGLAAIDDLDGESAEQIAAEYSALAEVEYAEPNYVITTEPRDFGESDPYFYSRGTIGRYFVANFPGMPNDPLLNEQWGLVNVGQREGISE